MEIEIEPTFQEITCTVRDILELLQKDGFCWESPEFLFGGDRYSVRLHRPDGSRTAFRVTRRSFTFPKREVSCKVGIRIRESTGNDCYYYAPKALEQDYLFYGSSIEKYRDRYLLDGSLRMVCCMSLSKESRSRSFAQEEKDMERNCLPLRTSNLPNMELSADFPCTRAQLTVPKFFDLPRETCDSLTSPEFRFAGDTYCFRFCPNDDTGDCDLQLVRLTFGIPDRTISYRVGYWWGEYHIYPKNSRLLVGSTGFCITRSKLEKERNKYAWDDTLRLLLFLRLGEQSSAGAGTSDEVQERSRLSGIRKLQSDLRQLLHKGTESDACVVVCGKEFQVHKNVLRARSTVFEAMFGHDTAEKESGRVVIDDLDPDRFGDFLEYLYTGDVQDKLSDDNAFDLYAVADKYDVSPLKSACVEHLRHTLSVDSFCDVVTLALRHREGDLLQQAIRFFRDNLQRIIITAKWQQFMSANSTSANELFIKVFVPGKQ